MTVTVRQLAEWVRGEVVGDADLPIANARTLADAEPGDITFVGDDRHLGAWHASRASAAVVLPSVPVNGRPIIRVADPIMAFARIVQHLRGRVAPDTHVVDPAAHVHPSVRLGPGVTVGPFAVIGEGSEVGANSTLHAGVVVGRGCRIGADALLHPRVVLYDDTVLGDRVTLHANVVLGADGFGFRLQNGGYTKIPQLGWVEIGNDVEIGAGTTVDRGTFGPTRVGDGTKIDNLVMIGHNCRIGRHNVLAAQVGIAGSTTTGDYVVMAGQSGISDHVAVGSRVTIGAKSGVLRDTPDGSRVLGYPAAPEGHTKRMWVALDQLPDLRKDVRRIQRHLGLGGA